MPETVTERELYWTRYDRYYEQYIDFSICNYIQGKTEDKRFAFSVKENEKK